MQYMKWVESKLGLAELTGRDQIDAFMVATGNKWLTEGPHAAELEPWCAAFAGTALLQDGYAIPAGVAAVRAASYGEPVAERIETPEFGCLVLLNYGMQGVVDHVTFYIGPDPRLPTTRFIGRGGNQGDMVKDSSFKLADVAGFYRPRKANAAQAAMTQPSPEPDTAADGALVGGGLALAAGAGAALWNAFGWIGLTTCLVAAAAIAFVIYRATRPRKGP